MASPPVLPDELVEEILLRLPPDDPACALRASLVCKAWGSALSHPSFRRSLNELHRAPPMLGFLHDWRHEGIPHFIPTTASSFPLAAPDRLVWWALDCRHGRALFLSLDQVQGTGELLVWEPTTGARRRVPLPAAFVWDYTSVALDCSYPNAAVLCAADACDHRDCHGGPFRLVFVFAYTDDDEENVTSACVYSSETETWGEPTSTHVEFAMDFQYYSSVLVGRSLLYFLSAAWDVVEYSCATHSLRVFGTPYVRGCILMLAEGGGLGVAELTEGQNPRLRLWSRDASDGTDTQWVLGRSINLEELLPVDAFWSASGLDVLGFAEGANVIFVNTVVGLFAIELQSERVKKVCKDLGPGRLIPLVSFYNPVLRNRHQGLPLLLNATEVAGGQEEKTMGPNAIQEETHQCLGLCQTCPHDRVPPCGDITPECTEMDVTLLYETQEVTDHLGDVTEEWTNEDLVKSSATINKDIAGNLRGES